MPVALRLTGSLRVDVLARCLKEIALRHEILRTVFIVLDGRPFQQILPSASCTLQILDLRGLDSNRREQEAQRQLVAEARQPFDLEHGPLLRTKALQLGDQEQLVLFTMHHAVSDGWSMEILVRELIALYIAISAGKPPALPALPVQYADFAVWQRNWLQGPVLEEQLAYWRRRLAGATSVLHLPTDFPRPARQTFVGAQAALELPKSLSDDLKALSRREGVTLYMTLLAAFKTLIYSYSGQQDLLIGSPAANRAYPEIEGLIGPFVNTLVLRTNLAGEVSFRSLLQRVRRVAIEAYTHQNVPFEKLVEELQPERALDRMPLFQVAFDLMEGLVGLPTIPGLAFTMQETNSGTAVFDLSLHMTATDQGLSGSMRYRADLFRPDTIARMLNQYAALLLSIVAQPAATLDQLLAEMLCVEQRRQQIKEQELKAVRLNKFQPGRRKRVLGTPADRAEQ
jgi:hypothetical protein